MRKMGQKYKPNNLYYIDIQYQYNIEYNFKYNFEYNFEYNI